VWQRIVRFVDQQGIRVEELTTKSDAANPTLFMLGCLERWQVIELRPAPKAQPQPLERHRRAGRLLRAGWGTRRGIRSDWTVTLTEKGVAAKSVWLPLTGEIENRWETRFGVARIQALRRNLADVTRLPASENFPQLVSKALDA
jgi:hypothetical protein